MPVRGLGHRPPTHSVCRGRTWGPRARRPRSCCAGGRRPQRSRGVRRHGRLVRGRRAGRWSRRPVFGPIARRTRLVCPAVLGHSPRRLHACGSLTSAVPERLSRHDARRERPRVSAVRLDLNAAYAHYHLAQVLLQAEANLLDDPPVKPRVLRSGPDRPPRPGAGPGWSACPAPARAAPGHHIHVARHVRRTERSARAEQSPRIEAGHSAVAARDHVEAVDEEVRVHGSTRRRPRTRADEQRARRTLARPSGTVALSSRGDLRGIRLM